MPVTKRSAFSGAEAVGHGAGHQAPRLQCDVQEEVGTEAGGTGALARQLLETAGRLYEAGNYHEAREAYQGVTAALQRAKETEAACACCLRRQVASCTIVVRQSSDSVRHLSDSVRQRPTVRQPGLKI